MSDEMKSCKCGNYLAFDDTFTVPSGDTLIEICGDCAEQQGVTPTVRRAMNRFKVAARLRFAEEEQAKK